MWRKKSIFRNLAMVSQLGFSVLASIFLCVLIGYLIDSRFGTRTMIVFLILGTLAGGRNAWILVKKMLEEELKEDEKADEDRRRNQTSQISHVSRPKTASRVFGNEMPGRTDENKEDADE